MSINFDPKINFNRISTIETPDFSKKNAHPVLTISFQNFIICGLSKSVELKYVLLAKLWLNCNFLTTKHNVEWKGWFVMHWATLSILPKWMQSNCPILGFSQIVRLKPLQKMKKAECKTLQIRPKILSLNTFPSVMRKMEEN